MSDPFQDFTQSPSSAFGPQASTSAGSVPFWGDNPNAWDKCVIGGVELPGIAEVDVDVEAKLDHKPIPGTHGATLTFIGYEAAKVKIAISVWTAAQLAALEKVVAFFRPTDFIEPVDIAHPLCALQRISSVKVIKMTGLKHNPGGWKTMEIHCLENWTPSRAKQAKVDSGSSAIEKHTNELTKKQDEKERAKPSSTNQSFDPHANFQLGVSQ